MWVKEFVQLSGATMLPFMAGIFTAVLPCLAYDTDNKRSNLYLFYFILFLVYLRLKHFFLNIGTDIKDTANEVNSLCMKLISIQVEKEKNLPGKYKTERF